MNYEKQWGAKKFKISSRYCAQKITSMFSNKSLCDEEYCSYNDQVSK